MSLGPRRQSGLGLVELMLGLAISAAIMAPLAGMLNASASAAAVAGERLALQREANFAVERIATRVRATKHSVLTAATQTTTSGGWLSPVAFELGGAVLAEKGPGYTRTLTAAVTAFSMTALPVAAGTQAIRVELTLARGTETANAGAVVRMGGPR